MSRTTLGSIIAALGALVLAAAAILYWVVVPNRAQLPSDTTTTRQFDGTANLLLNPQALGTGDLASAIITNAPVTASRTVKVLATDGGAAEVSVSGTLNAAGQPIGTTDATYAVDRKSFEATDDHPADWTVVPHEGLAVGWPIGVKQQDYTLWVSDTQSATPAKYLRDETRGGVKTYVYEATVAAAPIKDRQVLAALPPALPISALGALSNVLPLTDEQKAGLASLLPSLSQPVPLSYTYQAKTTLWVAPTTGIVVDVQNEEIRQAGLALGGSTPALSVPIYDVMTQFTDQTVADSATQAKSDGNRLTAFGRTLPLVLATIGGLAVIGGVVLIVLSRRRGPPELTP